MPSRQQLADLNDGAEALSRQELIDAYRALREALEAVRTCDERDGRCRLCPHCVTQLYVLARPAPAAVPPRYAEKPWRRP